ncbi:MAG TPA: YdcF family protein [Acetobacteraceae bacterium]|nr:YdcF family protein [Acetobacteraceae bacterium]
MLELQGALTALLLPPLLFVVAALAGGLLAWRGHRWAGGLVTAAALGVLLLATPFAAGHLVSMIEAQFEDTAPANSPAPAAIVILSADAARGRGRAEPGALTLERLRAGARLHRQTGLPVLVTGGPARRGESPLGQIMADSLREDFGIAVRWVEERSRDTRENALFSAEILREAGIESAWVVTHGWHLPRARHAFLRARLATRPWPVRIERRPEGVATDWLPRPDHLARSWYALREIAGRLVYRLRDGAAPAAPQP